METLAAFFKDWDFWINFVANLVGALVGVTLAFGIERWRARRAADNLYGRVLSACHYELNYSASDRLPLSAARAALLNPVVQERAPHSLIQIMLVLVTTIDNVQVTEERTLGLKGDRTRLNEVLTREREKIRKLIPLAIECVNDELLSLCLTRRPDPKGEARRQRLLEIVHAAYAEPPVEAKPQDGAEGKGQTS